METKSLPSKVPVMSMVLRPPHLVVVRSLLVVHVEPVLQFLHWDLRISHNSRSKCNHKPMQFMNRSPPSMINNKVGMLQLASGNPKYASLALHASNSKRA